MPSTCQRQETKKYVSRNSPPYQANTCKSGTEHRGNDGRMYVAKPNRRGVNRWIRSTGPVGRSYLHKRRKTNSSSSKKKKKYTRSSSKRSADHSRSHSRHRHRRRHSRPGTKFHRYTKPRHNSKVVGKPKSHYKVLHNGKYPYKVNISNLADGRKLVDVYAKKDGSIIVSYVAKHIFFGADNGGKSRGNTMLLYLGNFRYVYIGVPIHEFDTRGDRIHTYYSKIENLTEVPYPIAVGKRNAYYMGAWDGGAKVSLAKIGESRPTLKFLDEDVRLMNKNWPRLNGFKLVDDSQW